MKKLFNNKFKKSLYSVLAIVLCSMMIFSSADVAIVSFAEVLVEHSAKISAGASTEASPENSAKISTQKSAKSSAASEDEETLNSDYEMVETREQIKSRLMKQIVEMGWDPYSSNMSLNEFYALMELFQEKKLPLQSASNQKFRTAVANTSSEQANCIPRTMFMFSGLPLTTDKGEDYPYSPEDKPIAYNNDTGYNEDYPAGLDQYKNGYVIPPTSWQGVPIEDDESQAVVIVDAGINDADVNVAGDVVQGLFKDYRENYGYYIRRVTAENTNATVLGAVKLPGQDDYVYYYLTDKLQESEVSTTMLPSGKKFIVEYLPIEHTVEYEVYFDSTSGQQDVTKQSSGIVNVLGSDKEDTWENIIFGTNHPDRTDGSAYSFTAYAPYGYIVEFYIKRPKTEESENKDANSGDSNGANSDSSIGDSGDDKWGAADCLLGKDSAGSYKEVNGGFALGKEPDYYNGEIFGSAIKPNSNGPSALTMSSNIVNNFVRHDRKIIAVVYKNDDPTFLVTPLKFNTNNVSDRGASAHAQVPTTDGNMVPYDYEDVYLWANGKDSKYNYDATNEIISYTGKSDLSKGNVATCDKWNWQNKPPYNDKVQMNKEEDGTYSYKWTWQTNSSDAYTLNSLEINGVGVIVPFHPKYVHTDGGNLTPPTHKQWITETVLPDGAIFTAEFLMSFGSKPQNVYRFSVKGARSNVAVSAMNLKTGQGADEFVTYRLTGVIDDYGIASIEYYNIGYGNNNGLWTRTVQGNINVYAKDKNTGIDTSLDFNGDAKLNNANVRFKLADGYYSPYFLWESAREGTIIKDQASASRDDEGNIDFNSLADIQKFGTPMDSSHVYGPDADGWYYIRIETQDKKEIALLTIGAKQKRYVVRYIPETSEVPTPGRMPTFDHKGEADFSITVNGEQYDTARGAYYDVTKDTVIRLPSSVPIDPTNNYNFVDWVLVGEDFKPIPGEDGKGFHYRTNHINLLEIVDYALANENLGDSATDVFVLRFMPTWIKIENPFHYNVALNWVDAEGELHREYFFDWLEVLTDWDIDANGNLTVQVIKDAVPFKNWISNHPTYIFWDEVNTNNALYKYYEDHNINIKDPSQAAKDAAYKAMRDEMDRAIRTYLPSLTAEGMEDRFAAVLDALCTRDISGKDASGEVVGNGDKNGIDDFWRLGNYTYQVFEDYAMIVLWMREDKGGLVFSKEVKGASVDSDDEFYFTISQATTALGTPLIGTYKAYPAVVYDDKGETRSRLDSDAWLITFGEKGEVSIVKNDGLDRNPKKYFTLKHGEAIELYVPSGSYKIVELSSKSGAAYQVEVTYNGGSLANVSSLSSGWTLPGHVLWLKGFDKELCTHEGEHISHSGVSQVSATVYFEVGAHNMVPLKFTNMTAAVSLEKQVKATDENEAELDKWLKGHPGILFDFKVTLTLPDGYKPQYARKADSTSSTEEGKLTLLVHFYDKTGAYENDGYLTLNKNDDGDWVGQIGLHAGERAVIVMTAPDDGNDIYYKLNGEEIIVDNIDSITDVDGMPKFSSESGDQYELFYHDAQNNEIAIKSMAQIKPVTVYGEKQILEHKTGGKLYYLIEGKDDANDYVEITGSPSDVNLHMAEGGGVFDSKDVPLFYKDGSDYNLITSSNDLESNANADNVYYKFNDESYYHVGLKETSDSTDGNAKYDGVYEGTYNDNTAYILKKDFQVMYSLNDDEYVPVENSNDILVKIETKKIPVSKEIIKYSFEEVWTGSQWKDFELDPESGKPEIFIEDWTQQNGTTETGKLAEANIVNWYKNVPGEGYFAITQKGGKENENFLYRVTRVGTGETRIVSVKGNGITYVYAPCGEYTIVEINDWAWRYDDGVLLNNASEKVAKVTVTSANSTVEKAIHADFTNAHNDKAWLGGESSFDHLGGLSTINFAKQPYVITTAYVDEKKLFDSDNRQ